MTRRVAGIALATGLSLAFAGTAHADPSAVPTTSTAPPPTVAVQGGAAAAAGTSAAGASAAGTSAAGTATDASSAATQTAATGTAGGDVLEQLANEYAVGSGGGQLSNLLKAALKLKAMGFRPSKANLQEIAQAMEYRPNQMPLISALKDTIAYQQKLKAQMEILQQYQQAQAGNAVLGGSQYSAPSMGAPAQAPAPAPAAVPPMPAAPTP